MIHLIVVDKPKKWPLAIPAAPLVAARAYLTDPQFSDLRNVKVFNLCRSYRYQSTGYYVSLLAMARGHKPVPSITTIQDLKTAALARSVAGDLDELIQRSLRPIRSSRFTISIYFGQNLAQRYADLSARLFDLFQAPLLRAEFSRRDDEWTLASVRAIAANDIPEPHQAFVTYAAGEYFRKRPRRRVARANVLYDLAILHEPDSANRPSNRRALARFISAGRRLRFGVELVEREDFSRLAEFDALFIRATTGVNHYTYRFARRAAAEGLVVIDDPDSIAKCSNKVYLAELLDRHEIAAPRTLIVHKDNRDAVAAQIGLPCILKQPDSSFSQGVMRADNAVELEQHLERLLDKSDLVIAQEFMPTEFDWRIGILDGQPLFACQYFMVRNHWKIAEADQDGMRYGDVRAVPLDQAPRRVVRSALRAANLIGDGLYGVDVKAIRGKPYVVEINDNPNIDAGYEDAILKDELYERILQVFFRRIEQRKRGGSNRA